MKRLATFFLVAAALASTVPRAEATVPTKSCAGRDAAFSQERTLLGDGYDYRCGRLLWDCVAVRTDGGEFTSGLVSAEPVGTCDAGFTVNAVNVTVRDRQLQLFAMAASPGSMPSSWPVTSNLDPHREEEEASVSVALWKAQVGDGRSTMWRRTACRVRRTSRARARSYASTAAVGWITEPSTAPSSSRPESRTILAQVPEEDAGATSP